MFNAWLHSTGALSAGMPMQMRTGSRTAKSMAGGGTRISATLQAICETGQPPVGTRLMYWVFDHMEFVLPARTKSEHWPLKFP